MQGRTGPRNLIRSHSIVLKAGEMKAFPSVHCSLSGILLNTLNACTSSPLHSHSSLQSPTQYPCPLQQSISHQTSVYGLFHFVSLCFTLFHSVANSKSLSGVGTTPAPNSSMPASCPWDSVALLRCQYKYLTEPLKRKLQKAPNCPPPSYSYTGRPKTVIGILAPLKNHAPLLLSPQH